MNKELRWFLLLVGMFFLVNLITLSRFPSVWVDQVEFADPAVRLATGHGFTSTAWFGQDSDHFFAGNVPLYSGLLGGWLSLVGSGLVTERLFNILLFIGFMFLAWRFLRTSELVSKPGWRLTAMALLATGHAMAFSFRSGRYDVTGMFLAAAALNLWTARRGRIFLIAVGMLMPAAGLQMLPATFVACAILLLFQQRDAIKPSAMLLGGCTAGAVGLGILYSSFGVWADFRRSVSAIGMAAQSLTDKMRSIPAAYLHDKSGLLVFAAGLLLLISAARTRATRRRRFVMGALCLAIMLPAVLQMAGKFPIYYGWMIFVPLTFACTSLASDEWKNIGLPIRALAACLLTAAMAIGLPLRIVSVIASWNEREPQLLDAFVKANVPPGETVLADFKLYYALRDTGAHPILPTYIPALRPSEREKISVLLLRQADLPAAQRALGDDWEPTGEFLLPPRCPGIFLRSISELRDESYPIVAYRRAGQISRP